MVLAVGAFCKHVLSAFVPCVEHLAPSGSSYWLGDADEHVGESVELPTDLQLWFGGQVGADAPFARGSGSVGQGCAVRIRRTL